MPALDRKRLAAVSGGDADFERDLLEAFVEDARRHASSMVAAASAGDADALRREAHALKGSARNVGAPVVAALAAAIELGAAQGTADAAACARLDGEIGRLAAEATL